jgi:hypothetical protein
LGFPSPLFVLNCEYFVLLCDLCELPSQRRTEGTDLESPPPFFSPRGTREKCYPPPGS